MNKINIRDIASKYDTDKAFNSSHGTSHGYDTYYEKYLEPIREYPLNLMEIGVVMEGTSGGQSIKLWKEYLPNAKIYVIDILNISHFEDDRVKCYSSDSSNYETMMHAVNYFNIDNYDLIIDDASHLASHQQSTFGFMFKYVKSGGLYIIEDVSISDTNMCNLNNKSTGTILKNYLETKKINSEYISKENSEYIENNINKIEMYEDKLNQFYIIFITKK